MKKTNSVARLVGGAAGLTTGVLCKQVLNAPDVGDEGFVIAPLYLFSTIMGYIGIGTGIKSAVINRRITKDLKTKTLHDTVVIKSGGHYEGIIFVKATDYKPQFNITMHEKNNAKNSVIFDVDVRKNE
jgi:hypothetical protein